MTLTGAQLSRIHKAILDAYDRDELRQMILTCMDEDFSRHVSPEKRFSAQVFEFVEWANRQGRALELLRCAAEGNERNAGLQSIWVEAQTWDASVQPAKAPEPGVSPAAPHHIFLAYSRKDDAVMRRLRADLLAAGIVTWVDQDDLEPGTPVWQRAIESAIRAARCAVVILTPDAKESDWVNIEVSRAKRIGRRIFPVIARGDDEEAVPLMLETTNYVDVRTDYEDGVNGKLIPALRRHLRMTDAVVPSIVPKSTSLLDFDWITIPAGEFIMGSDKTCDGMAKNNELPPHAVNLGEYRIARYPVTNTQYLEFIRATNHQIPEHWKSGTIPYDKENHPIVNITQQDAEAFCKWANVRLPSEAEWEKAARGTDGRIWPWGNDPPTTEHCNFGRSECGTMPVGKYPKGASVYGVMEMAGNIWERTRSLYMPYPYQPNDGREDLESSGRRTMRGGSWHFDISCMRCAYRIDLDARYRDYYVGFRVVSPPH